MLLFILGVIRTEIVNLNTFIDESHLTNAFYITAEVTKINYQGEKQQIYAKCEDIIAQNKIINCNSRISFLVRSDYENRLTIGDLLKIESMQKKIINSEHTYLIYLEAFSYSKVGVKEKSIVKKEIAKLREKILTLIFAHYGYKEGSILT
ncbi:hypothetical protein KC660_02495, partial [Candidatus Dojkabacteria bacterium]|nr:hypothetical protein [Candidatus Dojkabacteria bacterium]